MITELFSKYLPWLTKTKLIGIVIFVVLFGGLFHACKGPNLNFGWPPWHKSEFQKTKDLVDSTKAAVKKNDKKVEALQKNIDESKIETKKIEVKKSNLLNNSVKRSKEISDAKNDIDKLDSLANGVF